MKPDPQEIINDLRKRPAMYTGEASLSSIKNFLNGYSFATDIYNVNDFGDPLLIPLEFHDWVAYRLHFYESTSGWCNMICSKTQSDQDAIDRFFILLDEYHNRHPHTVARLTGFQKTYTQTSYHRVNGHQVAGPTKTLLYPKSIILVTYTDDPGFFAYSENEDEFPSEGFFPTMNSFEISTGAKYDMLTILDSQWNPNVSTEQNDRD